MKALLALAVSALFLTACGGAHPEKPAASGRPPTRWVGTHGIEVAVPSAWRLNRGRCGTPTANTVLWNEDGVLQCLIAQPRGLSVVEFTGLEKGLRRSTGMVAGSREVQLRFPGRGITMIVLSPRRALLRRILGSLRTVRVDPNGCPTHPAPDYRRGPRPSSSLPFVPKGAVGVVGCSYKGSWLDQSHAVGRAAARRLAHAFAAAPFGFSHTRRGSVLPSYCPAAWRDSLIVARFEYASRPPVSVTAHLDGCDPLGASNGRWAIRLRPAWVYGLMDDAHYSGDYLPYGE